MSADGKRNISGHWGKGDLCYKVAENMVGLCSVVER